MENTYTGNSKSPKGLLERLLGLGKEPRLSEPLIIPRAEHTISRKKMEEEALKVLYRLHNSGHKAYLVGGAVRDLLLGRTPKDYDVATDARPDEIRKLFVNSRLIGRRFRLAHVMFKGRKVIEVSTFRRTPALPDEEESKDGEEDTRDLLIREDNTWGSPQQDAYRRDLTINALFYNIADFSIIDYVGGLADLHAKQVRMIGDPNIRFREDPVRMIRAVEYSARLDFEMDAGVIRSIKKHRKDLRKASDARMSDELLHLLRSGAAQSAFRKLLKLGLLEVLHTDLHAALRSSEGEQFFRELAVVDNWIDSRERVRDVLLFSILFNAPLRLKVTTAEQSKGGRLAKGEFLREVGKALEEGQTLYRVPNRRRHQVKQTVLAARKMRRSPSKQRGLKDLVKRAYFQDAFDLFRVEAESTGRYNNVLKEWIELQKGGQRGHPSTGREKSQKGGERKRPREDKRQSRQKDDRGPEKRRRSPERSKPPDRQPRAKREDPPELPVEEKKPVIQPPQLSEEMEHGRSKRENRSWNGVAGQHNSIVMNMKKKMESGEIEPPSAEDIPYIKRRSIQAG
jgi:poly(A) polymerase